MLDFSKIEAGHLDLENTPFLLSNLVDAVVDTFRPQALAKRLSLAAEIDAGSQDALIGDPTLFIRADEVGRSWRIVDPVLRCWAEDPSPIPLYQAATWGPPEAAALIARDGRHWRSLS